MFLINKPNEINFELTNWCNLRCKMCGIWAERPNRLFSLELMRNILKEKVLSGIKSIGLTGGEPFLITNLKDYYILARKYYPKSYINISTNGYFTKRTLKFLEIVDTKRTSIYISYDGIKSHDSIRRIEGSKNKLLETATKIKQNFPMLTLSLKLTVTPDNYNEILDTAKQCKNLGIPFRFKTMEKLNCHQNRYPSDIVDPDYDKEIIDSIKEQAEEVLKLKIETNKKYIKKLIKHYSGKYMSCNCSTKRVFIGIDGKVFLCRKKESIGDLNTKNIHDIWFSPQKQTIVNEMKTCYGCPESLGFIHE